VAASLPGHWGLFEVQPHPLLLLVLVIGIVNGNPSGAITGVFAASAYTALLLLQPGVGGERLPAALAQPVILLVAGVLAGATTSTARRKLARVERTQQQVLDRWRQLYERHIKILDAKAELEKRLLSLQRGSLASLCISAKRLQTLRTDELYPSILEVSAALLNAERVAVYVPGGGALQLRAGLPAELPGRPLVLSAAAGVAADALERREVVTAVDPGQPTSGQAIAAGFAAMAGPLLGADGRVAAIVVVEDLPDSQLSSTAAESFEQILDWASLALQNAFLHESMENSRSGVLAGIKVGD
jgi:hypothetical protein